MAPTPLPEATDTEWADFLLDVELLRELRSLFPDVQYHAWFGLMGISMGVPILCPILPHRRGRAEHGRLTQTLEAAGSSPHRPLASTRGREKNDVGNYSPHCGLKATMWAVIPNIGSFPAPCVSKGPMMGAARGLQSPCQPTLFCRFFFSEPMAKSDSRLGLPWTSPGNPHQDLSLAEEGVLLPWLALVRAEGLTDAKIIAKLRSFCGTVHFRCSGNTLTEQRVLDFAVRHIGNF
jgi:hypothetical protein